MNLKTVILTDIFYISEAEVIKQWYTYKVLHSENQVPLGYLRLH